MKIQYVLMKVSTETEYTESWSPRSFSMLRETEILRKDTEEEIVSVLDDAFTLAKQIAVKQVECDGLDISIACSIATSYRIVAREEIQHIKIEIEKLKDIYKQRIGHEFTYSLNDYSEYRIVKVYSA